MIRGVREPTRKRAGACALVLLAVGCSHGRQRVAATTAAASSQPIIAASVAANPTAAPTAPAMVDALGTCPSFHETAATETLHESPPKRMFSVDGYVARRIRIERGADEARRVHCVVVAWPPGDSNSSGDPVTVSARVDDGWLRGIENTLERLPWSHLAAVERLVIDNRPKEHGIAPFAQAKPDDARDGHTIWLHERLFEDPNHWAHGNYGAYWSYHVDVDGERLDDQPATHARFSPVLLHEIGHLVAYNVLNGRADDPTVPRCSATCGDEGGCLGLSDEEREQGCMSPYCKPFQFETGTENWAEQYRFFYQGSRTRALLRAGGGCVSVLAAHDGKAEKLGAPWDRGLPDVKTFHKSLWDSCAGRACKPW